MTPGKAVEIKAAEMLKAKLDCMIREYSGIDEDCNASNCDNCKLNYEQGTIGEQKEALRVAISALQTRNCATCKHNPPSKKYPCVDCDMRNPADRWEQRDAGDTISRQAAIDALNDGVELLKRVLDETDIVGAERAKYEWGLGLIESYISDIKDLPSVQPESCDDPRADVYYLANKLGANRLHELVVELFERRTDSNGKDYNADASQSAG